MEKKEKVTQAQKYLSQEKIDGWLIYNFQESNELALEFLEISKEQHTTRRFFYWIPSKGSPIKIVHAIESTVLDRWPGEKRVYLSWASLCDELKKIVQGKVVAMEYSEGVPYISKVDGGTIDLVRKKGAKVVSSGNFLLYFTAVLNKWQIATHIEACSILEKIVDKCWSWIPKELQAGKKIDEWEVQQFILQEMAKQDCVTEGYPICAVNAHSANPHYTPQKGKSSLIKKGDFILIDLWCRKNQEGAIFGDITKVAVADVKPNEKERKIFSIVRKAQKEATDWVASQLAKNKRVEGWEVDEKAREVVKQAGYEKYFIHRTGHGIDTQNHGKGTCIDNLEMHDTRPIIPHTCFSIEPGIYLPGEFGVRLEYDVLVKEGGEIEIHGGVQKEITSLF